MNVEKQVAYWLDSAKEDWDVAQKLIDTDSIRHGLFFVHLTVEKTLKALVCKRTKAVPPRIHNLASLSNMAGLVLDERQENILSSINKMNLLGRYPDFSPIRTDKKSAVKYLQDAEEIYQWLTKQL